MKVGKLLPLRRIDATAEEFSDAALIASCALGDSAAMGALIDRFHRPLYRFVSRLIGSSDSARDDLVQATFAEVAMCAGRFRGTSSVKVWMFGIAANQARNHIRSAVRRRRMELAVAEAPQRRVTQPDREVEQREIMAKLAIAIEELPDHLREAFVLCDLEEVPCREAAAALGVREGTIWRRVHDARQALRESLGGSS
jgi:RNA polymerase sigma-70 factor (ECF subfamily)